MLIGINEPDACTLSLELIERKALIGRQCKRCNGLGVSVLHRR
jgi:hypothetical protein